VPSPEPQVGDLMLEGAYQDYLRIFEEKLPPPPLPWARYA